MRIVAFIAVAALAGCSRNDKTATEEPVSTTTVTLAPITIAGPSDEELDRRANAATVAHVTGAMEAFDDLTGHPFSLPEGDERTQFHIQMALLQDADFEAHASDIDVQVDQGVVTLRGVTTTPEARTAAERMRRASRAS